MRLPRPARTIPAALLALLACAAPATPTVTIGDASVVEGNAPGNKLSFPITVDGPAGFVTLAIAARPDTALADDDFAPRLAVFTIQLTSGPNTSYRFEVPVTADAVAEPTETLTVAYRVITPGEVTPGQPGVGTTPDFAGDPTAATGTIVDDDAPVSLPGAAPPPAPPTPAPAPPSPVAAASKPSLQQVASLPSTKRCVSRRRFRIRLRSPKGTRVVSATVKLRGRTVATRRGKRITAPIDLRGLPKGRFAVSIRVVLDDGRVVTGTRTYRTCAPKHTGGTAPAI
jgi:hypothetical protein